MNLGRRGSGHHRSSGRADPLDGIQRRGGSGFLGKPGGLADAGATSGCRILIGGIDLRSEVGDGGRWKPKDFHLPSDRNR